MYRTITLIPVNQQLEMSQERERVGTCASLNKDKQRLVVEIEIHFFQCLTVRLQNTRAADIVLVFTLCLDLQPPRTPKAAENAKTQQNFTIAFVGPRQRQFRHVKGI